MGFGSDPWVLLFPTVWHDPHLVLSSLGQWVIPGQGLQPKPLSFLDGRVYLLGVEVRGTGKRQEGYTWSVRSPFNYRGILVGQIKPDAMCLFSIQ